jgi:hypothetical protein
LRKVKRIVCPKCGYDGSEEPKQGGATPFRYLEDIVNHRDVIRLNPKGVLQIESHYETDEGYDDGKNARLECRNCLHEFPIPPRTRLEFV